MEVQLKFFLPTIGFMGDCENESSLNGKKIYCRNDFDFEGFL